MLVLLPHGMAVNPEIVKLLQVRPDRQQGRGEPVVVYNVIVKTDDDGFLVLKGCETREEAEELVRVCAQRLNKGMGEDDPSEDDDDEDDEDDEDDDDGDEDEDDDDDDDDDEQEAEAEDAEEVLEDFELDMDFDW